MSVSLFDIAGRDVTPSSGGKPADLLTEDHNPCLARLHEGHQNSLAPRLQNPLIHISPSDLLVGSLATAPVPTLTTLALPPTADRSLSDVWSAMGGELKASIDLVVIAPLEPSRDFETGPPVDRPPLLRISADERSEERQGRGDPSQP